MATKTTPKTKKSAIKKTKVTKTNSPVNSTPVETVPAEQQPVVQSESVTAPQTDSPVDVDQQSSPQQAEDLVENFKSVCSNLNSILSNVKTLVTEVKKLEKRVQRELKDARKNKKKSKTSSPDKPKRAPSGFAKPSDISEELCVFLGRPFGTQMARTEVTKYVTQYIKDNGLQNPDNKRHILPDSKLGALLGAGKEEEVTYFNLQKYMKHHFPKSASSAKV